jgi:glycosyltransferase involved in cell wall biosynthesis
MHNKILIIYGSLNSVPSPEGAAPAKVIEETVKALNDSRFEVLSNTNPKLKKQYYDRKIFHHVKYSRLSRLLLFSLKLRYSYATRKQLFITASDQQLHFFIMVCLFVKKHKHKKLIVHVSPGLVNMLKLFCPDVEIVFYHHGTSLHTKLKEQQWENLIKNTKAIFGVNEAAKLEANKKFNKKLKINQYFSIPNGVNSMQLSKKHSFTNFEILYSGRICKEKGVLYLIKAYGILLNKGYQLSLNIAGATGTIRGLKQGDEYLKECLDYIAQNDFPVNFTGFLKEKAMKELYNKSHILVLPTDPSFSSEGLSLSLIEGMSCGLPLIATNSGGNPELITNGKNGFLIIQKENYQEELASHIEKLYLNPELYSRYSKYSRDKYLECFTVQKMSECFMDALKSIQFVK